jgi:hypothetical protein
MLLQHRGRMHAGLPWRVLLLSSALASSTCQLDERAFDAATAGERGSADGDGGSGGLDSGGESPSLGQAGSGASSAGSAGEVSLDPTRDGGLGGASSSGGGWDAGLRCEEDGGSCVACAGDGECDNGDFCDGAEICNSQGQCVPGPEPCSGPDGDADCSESCDEDADDCTGHDVRSSACAGGSCDGAGACLECLSGADCSPAQSYCSASGDCVACLEDAHCSNRVFCDGAETCNEGVCADGTEPCPGPDGDADCSEVCDEAAGSCTGNDPVESVCSGGLCTGSGVCAECLENVHCPLAEPFCLGTVCVECLVDGNCPSPTCTRGVCGQANRCETEVVCGP